MLNKLLPSKLPAARLGTPCESELTVVRTSGSEVAPASSSTPMNMPPRRVRTAMMSPYLASWVAARTISAALNRNAAQTMLFSLSARHPAHKRQWPGGKHTRVGPVQVAHDLLGSP